MLNTRNNVVDRVLEEAHALEDAPPRRKRASTGSSAQGGDPLLSQYIRDLAKKTSAELLFMDAFQQLGDSAVQAQFADAPVPTLLPIEIRSPRPVL